MTARRRLLPWLLLCGCTAVEPTVPQPTDRSGGSAVVVLASDGFGTLDGVRLPVDMIVLRLRQRTRALTAEQRAGFLVELWMPAHVVDLAAERRIGGDRDRLLAELKIMDVGQVQYRIAEAGA